MKLNNGYEIPQIGVGTWFVTTKVNTGIMRMGRQAVADSIDESLTKLKTDYIDLLLIHWPVKDSARPDHHPPCQAQSLCWESGDYDILAFGWGHTGYQRPESEPALECAQRSRDFPVV